MALIDRKINDWSQPVSSLDDKPQMTAAALKAAFDSNSNQLKPAINGIIDDLTGSQGALNIGLTPIDGLSGGNVQAVLQAVSLLLKNKDIDISNLERLFTADGASLVGLQPVSGVSASNLQQAIISLADTISKIDPYLGNAVPVSQGGTGAKTAQKALYNLGTRPNKNLLDNWYFVGGGIDGKFPINQMKLTNYTNMFNNKYGIDRWFGATAWGTAEASQTLEPDGLVVASIPLQSYPDAWGGMWQKIDDLEDYIGQTVTLSIYATDVQTADGTTTLYPKLTVYNENSGVLNYKPILNNGVTYITFEITAPDLMFGIQVNTGATQSNSLKIKAIKLEVGENQTLARQLEDGSWELLEKPDYAYELLKCQRYLLNITPSGKFNPSYIAVCTEVGRLYTTIPLPVQMRLKPTFVGEANSFQIALSDGSLPAPESVNVVIMGDNFICLILNVASAQIGQVADIRLVDETKKWLLSAEL